MNDNDLLRFASECPWATARLRRRHEAVVKFYLLGKLGSEILAATCLSLTFSLLPELCGECRQPVDEFLLRLADYAISLLRNLRG